MDERTVRHGVGRTGDGTTHRVDLTRHCIGSGAVQLPFALRDALPGGELLALDVDRDDAIELRFDPPRTLAGLAPYFAAHDLRANDALELRIAGGDVRLACHKRPRRDARHGGDPTDGARAVSTWTSMRDDAPRTERRAGLLPTPAATPWDGDAVPVVERIGSVTVRRLGVDRLAGATGAPRFAPSEPATPAEPQAAQAPRDVGTTAPSAPPATDPAAHDAAHDATRDARLRRPGRPLPSHAPDATDGDAAAAEDPALEALFADALPQADTLQADTLPTDTVPAASSPEARPEPHPEPNPEPHGEPRAASRDEHAADASSTPTRLADVRPTDEATDEGPADGRAVRQEGLFGDVGRTAPTRPPRVYAHDLADVDARGRIRTGTPDERRAARRDREEALSRAGDLRSRIVRWLLRPDTPVIVGYERVQAEFSLDADTTRDVLGGILDDPPASLSLTVLREGMLRIARVTVEQRA